MLYYIMLERPIIMWICVCIVLLLVISIISGERITYVMLIKVGIIGGIYGFIILLLRFTRKTKENINVPFLYNKESTCRCHKRKGNIYPECFHCNSQPYVNY